MILACSLIDYDDGLIGMCLLLLLLLSRFSRVRLLPPGSSLHGILQARIMEWVAISFSRGSPNPGIELGSPALQADSLPTELRGKANTKIKDIVTISE